MSILEGSLHVAHRAKGLNITLCCRKSKKNGRRIRLPLTLSLPTSTSDAASISDATSNVYVLCAVQNHSGKSADSGHYVAEVMDWTTGVWFECNDESVKMLDNGPSGVGNDGSSRAYNLFYVKQDYLARQVKKTVLGDDAKIDSNSTPAEDSDIAVIPSPSDLPEKSDSNKRKRAGSSKDCATETNATPNVHPNVRPSVHPNGIFPASVYPNSITPANICPEVVYNHGFYAGLGYALCTMAGANPFQTSELPRFPIAATGGTGGQGGSKKQRKINDRPRCRKCGNPYAKGTVFAQYHKPNVANQSEWMGRPQNRVLRHGEGKQVWERCSCPPDLYVKGWVWVDPPGKLPKRKK